MAGMTFEEFYKAACEKFGEDKFTIKKVQVSEEELNKFNEQSGSHVTLEQVQELEEVWLMKDECPHCGEDLCFSFEWGLMHGTGRCSSCRKTVFKYYHYVGDSRTPIRAYSLIGF